MRHFTSASQAISLHGLLLSGVALLGCSTAWAMPVCNGGIASIPTLDPLSASAAIGDFTLTCGGGAAGEQPFLITVQSFLNTDIDQDVSAFLNDGTTSYQGIFSGTNSVTFQDVLFDPLGSLFSMQGIHIDASALAPGSFVVQFVSLFASSVPLSNPQQIVATIGELPVDVPEPGTTALFAIAFGGLMCARRKKSLL